MRAASLMPSARLLPSLFVWKDEGGRSIAITSPDGREPSS